MRHLDGLRLYAWWAAVFMVIGTATGILITGAGGRLIMRLLAMTSPEATGRLTEGQAAVGEISLEGTLAFTLFGALPFAFASALSTCSSFRGCRREASAGSCSEP